MTEKNKDIVEDEEIIDDENVSVSKEEYERLKKLEEKDHNFEALRKKQLADIELTDEEKERLLGDKIEEVKKTQDDWRKEQEAERIDDALDLFAGGDEDLREKILYNYNRLSDKAVSRQEIMKKMKDAAGLSGQSQSMPDPINRAATYYSGAPAQRQEKGFSESENGQALKSVLGLGNMDVYAAKGLKVKKETK